MAFDVDKFWAEAKPMIKPGAPKPWFVDKFLAETESAVSISPTLGVPEVDPERMGIGWGEDKVNRLIKGTPQMLSGAVTGLGLVGQAGVGLAEKSIRDEQKAMGVAEGYKSFGESLSGEFDKYRRIPGVEEKNQPTLAKDIKDLPKRVEEVGRAWGELADKNAPTNPMMDEDVMGIASSAIGQLPAQLLVGAMTGPAGSLVSNALNQYVDSFDTAKSAGLSDEEAHVAGLRGAPTALLDTLADRMQIKGLKDVFFKSAKAGLKPSQLGRIAQAGGAFLKQTGVEGGTEALQERINMNLESGYRLVSPEEERRRLRASLIGGVAAGGVVGGIEGVGRYVRSGTGEQGQAQQPNAPLTALLTESKDEAGLSAGVGPTLPETTATLINQRNELIEGKREAMLYTPGEKELGVPQGYERLKTEAGVFHFNPEVWSGDEIKLAVERGELGRVLDYGIEQKPDGSTGEVTAVVRRDEEGQEIERVISDQEHLPEVLSKQGERAEVGQTVATENPVTVFGDRKAQLKEMYPTLTEAELEALVTPVEVESYQGYAGKGLRRQVTKDFFQMNQRTQERMVQKVREVNEEERQKTLAEASKFRQEAEAIKARNEALQEQLKREAERRDALREELERLRNERENLVTRPPLNEQEMKERAEQERQEEQERAWREEAESDLASEAGEELLDVLRANPLPAGEQHYKGELKAIAESGKGVRLQFFRKNAKPLSQVREAFNEAGFNFETETEMLDAIETRLRTQKPMYGYGAALAVGENPFSLSKPNSVKPMNREGVVGAVKGVLDRWQVGRRGTVAVVERVEDLPEGLREQAVAVREVTGRSPEAVYDRKAGRTYLVAENLSSAERARKVLLHEVVGHRGVEAVLGESWGEFADEVWGRYAKSAEMRAVVSDYALDTGTVAGRRKAVSELLARLAEGRVVNEGLWERLLRMVREALALIVPEGQWSDEQLGVLLRRDVRKVLDQAEAHLRGEESFSKTLGEWIESGKEQAKRLSQRLGERIDEYRRKVLVGDRPIELGRTPMVLRAVGADDLPVVMSKSVLRKAEEKHGLNVEALAVLPEQLQDPVMVFQSQTEADALVVLTELWDGKHPIVVAVHLSRTIQNHEVNYIASVHAKDSAGQISQWMNNGGVLYQNKKKSLAWSRSRGLYLPKEASNPNSPNSTVVTEEDFVKGDEGGDFSLGVIDETAVVSNVGRVDDGGEAVFSLPAGESSVKRDVEWELLTGPRVPGSRAGFLFTPRRWFLGTADILERTRGLEFLAKAIRHHVDRARYFEAKVLTPFREWEQKYRAKKVRDRAYVEFEAYWGAMDKKATELANRAYALEFSEAGKELIDLWRGVSKRIGRMNQANGLLVWDSEKKMMRPIRVVADYFPRSLKPEVRAVLQDPASNPELFKQIRKAMIDEGLVEVGAEDVEVISRLRQAVGGEKAMDYLGHIESARQLPLPHQLYDYSFRTAGRYLRAWAERMAQIEAFGQKLGKDGAEGKDLFDVALGRVYDEGTRQYIEAVRARAYSTVPNSAWRDVGQFFNTVTTGAMLGNWATTMLNLVSGIGHTVATQGVSAGLKGAWEMRQAWQAINEAYELGVLQNDVMNMMHDSERVSGPVDLRQTWWQGKRQVALRGADAFAGFMLKWGGFNASEEFVRAHGLLTAKAFLRQAQKAYRENPTGRESLQYLGWFKRNALDGERLMREGLEGMAGQKYLRMAVNTSQGGYRYDQVPVFVDSPLGRFVFKFQKWGTQATRNFMLNVWEPAFAPGTVKVNGEEVKVPRDFVPMARYMAVLMLAGMALDELKEWIFGASDPTASWVEVLNTLKEDELRALGLVVGKLWNRMLTAGALGVVGNYTQGMLDVFERSRFKNPLDPPGLQLMKNLGELGLSVLEQGKVTGDDVREFMKSSLSAWRRSEQVGARVLGLAGGKMRWQREELKRQDLQWLRTVTRRYAEEMDVPMKRTSMGRMGKTPMTAFYRDVWQALMIGDEAEARRLVDRQMEALDEDERSALMRRLRGSVAQRRPVRVGGSTADDVKEGFLDWARRRLPRGDVDRIEEIDRTYREAAVGVGLLRAERSYSEADVLEAIERIKGRR